MLLSVWEQNKTKTRIRHWHVHVCTVHSLYLVNATVCGRLITQMHLIILYQTGVNKNYNQLIFLFYEKVQTVSSLAIYVIEMETV